MGSNWWMHVCTSFPELFKQHGHWGHLEPWLEFADYGEGQEDLEIDVSHRFQGMKQPFAQPYLYAYGPRAPAF